MRVRVPRQRATVWLLLVAALVAGAATYLDARTHRPPAPPPAEIEIEIVTE